MKRAGIGRMRMRELWAFCRQYDEARAGAARGGTWQARRVEAIDSALEAVEPGLRRAMLNNVARGVCFEWLDAPCARGTFYRQRRAFFERLDEIARGDRA